MPFAFHSSSSSRRSWFSVGLGCVLVLWCLSTGTRPVCAGNLVANGSFDAPGFDHASQAGKYRYLNDAGDTSISSWTISRLQQVGERVYWYHASLYNTFSGEYALALTDAGRAQTQVAAQPGQVYELQFVSVYDLNNPLGNFALRVSLGDAQTTLLPADTTDTGISVGNQNWRRYRARLRPATGGRLTLAILNIPDGFATPDGGIAIDDVSLTNAVPEPDAVTLLALALATALLYRHTRRPESLRLVLPVKSR